jgi:hypothetical protein
MSIWSCSITCTLLVGSRGSPPRYITLCFGGMAHGPRREHPGDTNAQGVKLPGIIPHIAYFRLVPWFVQFNPSQAATPGCRPGKPTPPTCMMSASLYPLSSMNLRRSPHTLLLETSSSTHSQLFKAGGRLGLHWHIQCLHFSGCIHMKVLVFQVVEQLSCLGSAAWPSRSVQCTMSPLETTNLRHTSRVWEVFANHIIAQGFTSTRAGCLWRCINGSWE